MSIQTKKTTLSLDDIQMIGDVVQDSESRLNKKMGKLITRDEFASLIRSTVGEIVEEKFKEVVGNYPNRNEFHTRLATQAKTVEKVEQEQIVLTHQMQRIDKRVTILEKKAFT